LAVVILMPVIGGLASLALTLSEKTLAIYLGFFTGFILYIAASNLLPQAHSEESNRSSIILTLLGVAFMFFVTRLA
jgi:zinc and cadmium transporter